MQAGSQRNILWDGLTFVPECTSHKKPFIAPEAELIAASSLLNTQPELKQKSYAAEIAWAEYVHYVAQTYYFEVLGVQIVSDLVVRAQNFDQFQTLSAHASDEERHVRHYYELYRSLPYRAPVSPAVPRLYEKIVCQGSFIEKVIKGLIVLEAGAIGVFAARLKLYPNGTTRSVDQQILKEETKHHGDATAIVASFLREEKISLQEVNEICRQGVRELSCDLLPVSLIEKFSLNFKDADVWKLKDKGLVGIQADITRKCLKNALLRLQQEVPKCA